MDKIFAMMGESLQMKIVLTNYDYVIGKWLSTIMADQFKYISVTSDLFVVLLSGHRELPLGYRPHSVPYTVDDATGRVPRCDASVA